MDEIETSRLKGRPAPTLCLSANRSEQELAIQVRLEQLSKIKKPLLSELK
jgi:hypothetical protein